MLQAHRQRYTAQYQARNAHIDPPAQSSPETTYPDRSQGKCHSERGA